MTTTINASPTNGLVQTADGSGVLKVQSNGVTTNALAWGSYAYVGSGSVPTLKSSYNISSITRNSTGNYTFAFTTASTDANYGVASTANQGTGTSTPALTIALGKSTTSFSLQTGYGSYTVFDLGLDFIIFGN